MSSWRREHELEQAMCGGAWRYGRKRIRTPSTAIEDPLDMSRLLKFRKNGGPGQRVACSACLEGMEGLEPLWKVQEEGGDLLDALHHINPCLPALHDFGPAGNGLQCRSSGGLS